MYRRNWRAGATTGSQQHGPGGNITAPGPRVGNGNGNGDGWCYGPPWPEQQQGDCGPNVGKKCFTQLGGRATAIPVGVSTPIVVTPVNLSRFTVRSFMLAAFDDGANTRILHGQVDNIQVFGNTYFAGGAIPFDRFANLMPFLELQGQDATPQNPITVNVTHFVTAAVVSVSVMFDGMGYQ